MRGLGVDCVVTGVVSVVLALFTVTGGVVWIAGIGAVLYFRPDVTPNGSFRGAVSDIRWSYAVAFFVAPVTVAGLQDGTPALGFAVGSVFVLFIFVVQWWYPI